MDKSTSQMMREILCAGYSIRLSYSHGSYEAFRRFRGESIRVFYADTYEKLIEHVYKESVK